MKTKEQKIHCYTLPNNLHSNNYLPILNSVYSSWKKSWFDLFSQIEKSDFCTSDEFSRQDYFLLLYLNNELAGTVGCRKVNLCSDIGSDDSYMQPWPKAFHEENKNKSILLTSGFNIEKSFRGRFSSIPTVFIFGSFIMRQFLSEPDHCMVTIARNDAGVNKLCSALGAKTCGRVEDFHGKQCDLMAFTKNSVKPYPLKGMEATLKDISIQNYDVNQSIKEMGA